jgi:hypothetical protein
MRRTVCACCPVERLEFEVDVVDSDALAIHLEGSATGVRCRTRVPEVDGGPLPLAESSHHAIARDSGIGAGSVDEVGTHGVIVPRRARASIPIQRSVYFGQITARWRDG